MSRASTINLLLVLVLVYWIPVRLWYRRWGVTDAEMFQPMAADHVVPHPDYSAMLAVTIDASPDYIWPWLVQMGKGRGGLYSYDWLDRVFGYLDGPSSEEILPQFQQVAVGDIIPVGGPAGFPVVAVQPHRLLAFGGAPDGFEWVWELGLAPVSRQQTRLISRSRAHSPASLRSALMMLALEPAAFIMTRKMLLGIKRRAECLQNRNTDRRRGAGDSWFDSSGGRGRVSSIQGRPGAAGRGDRAEGSG
jgi:hypothetical protein